MADKLSVQQLSTLNTYLKKHPNAKREDAIKLLFDNSAKKPSGKGVKVEHNKSNKKQTITLKSGLSVDVAKGASVETKEGKITLSKSGRYSVTGKDGKVRYYAANGTELNEKYFKQVESSTGNVTVKNSKGVTVDVNKRLQNRIARASKALKHEEDNQGLIGKLWSGAKNTFGFGDSSDKVQQQLKQEQKLLKQFNQQPQNRAKIFKQLTGLEYNTKNMQDFVEGKIQLKSEQKLDAYKEGQATAVDVTTDIVSGVASFAVYSAAVAAAPFTGGASIAAGVVLAGAVGAGTKVALKAGETIGTDKKYNSLGHDLVMGAANGAISTVTAGLGGAVAKSLATRMGLEVVKAGAKEVAKQGTKQVVSQATKQAAKQGFKRAFSSAMKGAKEGLINPGGYKYVAKDGVKNAGLKKFGAYMAEGATDGGLSGGAISGVETAHNGGSAEDVLKATAFGALSGAVMGGVMNYGMNEGASAAGKLFKGKAKTTTEVAADAVETSVTKNADNSLTTGGSKSVKGADDAAPTPKAQGVSSKITIISKDSTIASDKEIMDLLKNSKPPIHRSFHSREEWLEFKDIIKDYSSSAENIINEYLTPIMRGAHTNWANVNKILKSSIDADGNLNLSKVKTEFDAIIDRANAREHKKQELRILIKEKMNIDDPEVIGHIASASITADNQINTELIDFMVKMNKKGLKEYNYEIILDYLRDFNTNKINTEKIKIYNKLADTNIEIDDLKYIYSKINLLSDVQKTQKAADKIIKILEDKPELFNEILEKNSAIFNKLSVETLEATEYLIKNNVDKKTLENLSHSSCCKANSREFDELLTKIAQRDLLNYKEDGKSFSIYTLCDMARIPDETYSKFIERGLQNRSFTLGDKIRLSQLTDKEWRVAQDKKLLSNFQCKTANDIIELLNLTDKDWNVINSKNLLNNPELLHLGGANIAKMSKFNDNQWKFIDKNELLKTNQIDKTLVEFIGDLGNAVNKNSISELTKQEKRNLLMLILRNKNMLTNKSLMNDNYYSNLKIIPLLPTDEISYAKTMRQVSQSLNISFEPLPMAKIEEFNNVINNLYKTFQTLDLSELSEINLSMTHQDFIQRTKDAIKELTPDEQIKIQDYFGFKIENNKLIGYPNSKNIDFDSFGINDSKSQKAIQNLKKIIEDYTDNNFITTKDNPVLNQQLKGISKSIPEIFNQIDGSNTPVEIIKDLQKIVKNPNFDKLSESDKQILTIATLLHKTDRLSNNATESAFDAYYIAKKFNLSKTDAQKVYTIIENSDAIEKFMSTSRKVTSKNYRGTVINGQERENMFDLIAFKLKEDNLFELTQMLYSAKQPEGLTRNFDTLLVNRIKEIKSSDFILPQTTRETMMSKASIKNINGYDVNVVNASDIENFYALIHTPEAGYATGGTRSANFANFDAFETLNDDKVICTSYISSSKAALVHEYHHGFIFDVANDKQYVGYPTDIFSLGKNIDEMLVEYFRDRSIKANRGRGDKFEHRNAISSRLKRILYGNNVASNTSTIKSHIDVIIRKYDIQIKNLNAKRKELIKNKIGSDKITVEQYKEARNNDEILKLEQYIKELENQRQAEIKSIKDSYPEIEEINEKYIMRLDEIKKKLDGKTMTIENIEQIDSEFAEAYKKLLVGSDILNGFRHNEVLVSNPKISAIFTDDINKLPKEYLIKAQEENLPIVIIK